MRQFKKFDISGNIRYIYKLENNKLKEIIKEIPKTYKTPTLAPFCRDEEKYDVVKNLVLKIQDSYNNWDIWKKWHVQHSKEIREKFSWKNQAKLAYNRLKEIEIKPVTSEAKLAGAFNAT